MALPADNIWLVRQNYIGSLRDILLKNITFLEDFIQKFKDPNVLTESKLIEYSKQASTYSKTLSLVYGYLFDAEEYENAYVEVNGLPQDVQTLLIAGLNISTSGLDLAEINAGTWVSAIYNILINATADVSTISDVLSWMQYGLNVCEEAKRVTFPEPPPQNDEVPDAKRTPNKNMIYDWEAEYSTPFCTTRGMLVKESYEYIDKADNNKKKTKASRDFLFAVTIGEGATTSTTEVKLTADKNKIFYEKCIYTQLPDIFDVEKQEMVQFPEDTFVARNQIVPILVKTDTQGIPVADNLDFEYKAALEIRVNGSLWLISWFDGDAKVKNQNVINIVNHATYCFYFQDYSEIIPITAFNYESNDEGLAYASEVRVGSVTSSFDSYRQEDGQTPDVELPDDKTFRLDKYLSKPVAFLNDAAYPLASTINLGQNYWGVGQATFASYEDSDKLSALERFPFLNISTTKFEFNPFPLSGSFDVRLAYTESHLLEPPKSDNQFLWFSGSFKVLAGGVLNTNTEYKLYTIPDEQNKDHVWNNVTTQISTISFKNNYVIRYTANVNTAPFFSIINFAATDRYVDAGYEIPINFHMLLATPHTPKTVNGGQGASLIKLRFDEYYMFNVNNPDVTKKIDPSFGIQATYYASDRPFYEGDVVKDSYHREDLYIQNDVEKTCCHGMFPNKKSSPKATLTFSNFIFNIYCSDNFNIVYEFVLRTKGWKQGKIILFSKGAIAKDFIPAQHLVMQLGLKSYIVIQNDGSAIMQLYEEDLKKLQIGDRFTITYPSLPLFKVKAFTPPTPSKVVTSSVQITPGELGGASLLPYFGFSLVKGLHEDPPVEKENLYYEWVGMNVSNFTRAIVANIVNLVQEYDSSSSAHKIKRFSRAKKEDNYDEKTVVSPADFTTMWQECLFKAGNPNDSLARVYSSDGVALNIISYVLIKSDREPDSEVVKTQKYRIFLKIAEFPWALDLIKNIKKDAETLSIGLMTLLQSWDQISKYDYFKSITEHSKQYSVHMTLISDLLSRIQNETRGAKNGMPIPSSADAGIVSKIGSAVYEAWNNRWNNL